jgi:processive 1,2-diacylglycerol beta-glucosyltransferase
MKKIMILTASFGAGHKSASRAIKEHLLRHNNNYDIDIVDFVDASIPEKNEGMVRYYEIQTKYFPMAYNAYYYTKKHINSKYDKSHFKYLEKLEEFLIRENPDLIISTFPHASKCVSDIKKRGNFDKKLVTVITDVVVSNEWIHEGTDLYFVPAKFVKDKLVKRKIPKEIIKVTGVPVDSNFSNTDDKSFKEKRKLLFMGGGRGLFDVSDSFFYWLDKYIEKNKDSLEASIVTGTNKVLFNKLTVKKPLKNIKVHGFVDNMPEKIKKHNLIITKAGGATLFESINSCTPIFVKKPEIGQEIANAKFINREKIGRVYNKESELKKIIRSFSKDKCTKELDTICENIENFKCQLDMENMYNHIKKLIKD